MGGASRLGTRRPGADHLQGSPTAATSGRTADGSSRLHPSQSIALAVGIADTTVFVYGLFAIDEDAVNVLSLNDADNGLHLVAALVALAAALWPARDRDRGDIASSRSR